MTYTPLNTFAPGQTGFAAKLNNEVAHLGAYTDTNAPTSGQLLALAGTTGTPSNTNRYVTDSDTRLGGVVTAASTPKIRTTGRTGRALMSTNSIANQTWTAVTYTNYDLIVLNNSANTSRLATIKTASPTTLVLAYIDLLFAGVPGTDACMIDVSVARTNGWLATTNGTTEIVNPFAPASAQRLLDPGRPGVKEALTASMLTEFATDSRWDGLFLDDINPYGESWTAVPVISGYTTVTQWCYAIQHCIAYMKLAAPTKLLIGNMGDWEAVPTEQDRVAMAMDGGFKERFAQDNTRTAQTTTSISNELASVNKLTSAGKIYFGEVQNVNQSTDTQSMRYGLAAMLAMGEPGYWVLGSAQQGDYNAVPEPSITELGRDNGQPISVTANASGLVSRTYRNYTIQANTTSATLSGVAALTGVFTAR
jgi:hypothetical protein